MERRYHSRIRPSGSPPRPAFPWLTVIVVLLAAGFLARQLEERASRPAMRPLDRGYPPVPAIIAGVLPEGAQLRHTLPLQSGAIAITYVSNGSVRAGVVLPASAGRHTLWSDAAHHGRALDAEIAQVRHPGLSGDVLSFTFHREDGARWIQAYELTDPPRPLFTSAPEFPSAP